ncbi:MAG TPA: DUF983 domain-containing protein [Gemmatimonadaceae bacterium]|nr:DUF983 domain-containing protein [Gemmatimonadaceae bacterium]
MSSPPQPPPSPAPEEPETRTGLQLATPRQAARLLGRALTLRCPNCGGGPVLQHWLRMRVRCGRCGLRLERGEHDYFLGSLLFNFILAGLLFLATLVVILLVTWPDVPWDALEIVLPVLIVVAPVVLFPFSKLVWLAFDLMLRPVTPEELAWHRAADSAWSTERAGPGEPPAARR